MQNLTLGLVIGATLSGTFQTAFGQAKNTLKRLDEQTNQLTARQERLGRVMSQSLARPHANLSRLHTQYQHLGQVIEKTRYSQERLNRAMQVNQNIANLHKNAKTGLTNEATKLALLGGGVGYAVKKSANFEDQIIDMSITGGWSKTEEAGIGKAVRESAIAFNQTTEDINRGLGTLVAGGIGSAKEIEAYAPKLARTATAWRASFEDLGSTTVALHDNLGIGADDWDRAMNILGQAGKEGQFEVKDMAKWLPSLTPYYKSLGIQGEEAVAEIGASLQIARKGAGTSDEAANNFRNFLSKLTSDDTKKDFIKAGVNIEKSMENLVGKGMTPMKAMFATMSDYMQKKSPQAAGEFIKAMQIKDDKEREIAVQRLAETYKLGQLFQDQQALSFIRPMLADMNEFGRIEQTSLQSADKDTIGQDYQKRMGSSVEQYKSLKIFIDDLAITLGDILKPALLDVANVIKPIIAGFASWAKENPNIVSGVVGLVAGMIAFKLVLFGVGVLLLPIIGAFTKMWLVARQIHSAVTFLKGLRALGRFAPIAMRFGQAIRAVGIAFNFLKVAILTNPLAWAIGLLAVAGYLIYKNWTPIKAFFKDVWAKLKTYATQGVQFIKFVIINFNPLTLFIRAWSAVFNYFSGLGAKFANFGRNIIQGLVNGITSKFNAVKATISDLAGQVSGWFKGKLGINSPSKVFAKLGGGIPEGVALGIQQQTPQAIKASADMAKRLAQTEYSNRVLGSQSLSGGMRAGQIHFSPTINVQVSADSGDVSAQVQQGLNASYAEFERMLEQVEYNRRRRAFA